MPFGLGSAEWETDSTQQNAAWALYVELVTHIAVQELADDAGLVREAMNSLHTLFGTTRQIWDFSRDRTKAMGCRRYFNHLNRLS